MKRFLILVFIVVCQVHSQTIRPNHWLDFDMRFYWHRGCLWNLSPLEKPLSQRLFIREMLAENIAHGEYGYFLLSKMPKESESALVWLQSSNIYESGDGYAHYHAKQRATLSAQLVPWLEVYGTFYVDNRLSQDSTYMGKEQNGLSAFWEQAAFAASNKNFTAKFGRDYLMWGPGYDATLMISDVSRPLDHLYLAWQNRWLKFSYFTATLDQTEYPANNEPSVQNRYLSGHRLELRPLKYYRIAISETALFGGPHAGNDFAFMNPLLIYTAVQHNGPQTANVMASLDMMFMPIKNLSIYGAYLLDDTQFEDSIQSDQEPPEIGYLFGFNYADLKFYGLDLFAEYSRVTNRTYNGQGGGWEKYLHRNMPIGHFLGNDFDRILLGLSYRSSDMFRATFFYEKRQKGEGRIEKPFDTPWKQLPPGTPYSEPFPTGVVEKSDLFTLSARWQPKHWIYLDLVAEYVTSSNWRNQQDVCKNYGEIKLKIGFELFKTFSIQ